MTIKAVILDMDGLLIDSEPLWREAEKVVFGKVNIQLTDDMCHEVMGLRIDDVINYWYQKFPWEGPSKKQIEVDVLQSVKELVLERGTPLPGVLSLLHFFQSGNMPIALASSSPAPLIETVLSKLSITEFFTAIHSADAEPYGKPHPGLFLRAANSLKTDAKQCLVFEDSCLGLIAAKAARMKAVLVPAEEHIHDEKNVLADLILSSLEEFNEAEFKKLNEGL